jgi:hypothetical protein
MGPPTNFLQNQFFSSSKSDEKLFGVQWHYQGGGGRATAPVSKIYKNRYKLCTGIFLTRTSITMGSHFVCPAC